MPKSCFVPIGIALLLSALTSPAAFAARGAPVPAPQAEAPKTPEQMAIDHYNTGLRRRDRAWKLEQQMAEETDDAKRAKLEARIGRFWESAIQEFRLAVTDNPRMHQAFSSLGYALRKTGDYESSLVAYDRALELAPGYAEAIEYRAEAHLALGRLEEAKSAYMTLFNQDRERSEELLEAMQRWVEERRADPAGVAAEKVEELARWVEQRGEIAAQTSAFYGAGGEGARSW